MRQQPWCRIRKPSGLRRLKIILPSDSAIRIPLCRTLTRAKTLSLINYCFHRAAFIGQGSDQPLASQVHSKFCDFLKHSFWLIINSLHTFQAFQGQGIHQTCVCCCTGSIYLAIGRFLEHNRSEFQHFQVQPLACCDLMVPLY